MFGIIKIDFNNVPFFYGRDRFLQNGSKFVVETLLVTYELGRLNNSGLSAVM